MEEHTASSGNTRRGKERGDTADAVLDALRIQGPSTVSALVSATGFSRPTVSLALDDLSRSAIVTESSNEPQKLGRPAGRWSIREDAGFVIGMDLLPLSALLCAADISGRVIRAQRIDLPHDVAADRLDTVIDAVRALVDELSDRGPLRYVAVSTTGKVSDKGTILLSDLIPVWNGLNLADAFHHAFCVPVSVDNDINMAALGEFESRRADGRTRNDGDLLFVQLAGGVNTGLVLGGRVHRGRQWNAGELSEVLDLRLVSGEASDEWVERAALTIASVGAVVDPDSIVISLPIATLQGVASRVVRRIAAMRRPHVPDLVTEIADLGWAASVVGALHAASRAAAADLSGAAEPRPVLLTNIDLIRTTLERGKHTTMRPLPSRHDTDVLRVGVVGCGARADLALATELPENKGQIVAVCDPHPKVEERVRSRLKKDPRDLLIHRTVDELIDSGIDVAIVTSPDDTHADVSCALLEAGVPVYLEKPLAITMESATRVLCTARDTGTKLYVGHNMRHMNVVRQMRDLIRAGRIGEVKAVWCRHFVGNGGDYYFKDWHAEREHVNSLLLQKAAHDIDVMHWLADSHTSEVVAMGGLTLYDQVKDRSDHSDELMGQWFSMENWPPLSQKGLNPIIDVEDLSMVLMKMESGVFASYQQCHYTPDYWRNYTVIGTEGRLENFGDTAGGCIRLWNRRSEYNPEGDEVYPIIGDSHGHGDADILTVTEFIRFVREGQPTDTSPLGAWYAVAAGIKAADSLRNGSRPEHIEQLPTDVITHFLNNQKK